MCINNSVINNDEKIIFNLRSLYTNYGYSQFKMSKFEEYDLYVKNKDYLMSENIITFNDTDGKLMALKPDVTLSIIKNNDCKKGNIQKVFYNENVYRVSNSTNNFKEIMQVGLECIGDIDFYNIFEVIKLASKSLKSISDDYVLDISNMDIILGLIDSLSVENKIKNKIIKAIGEKSVHEIRNICLENELNNENVDKIIKLVSLHGDTSYIIDELKKLNIEDSKTSIEDLEKIIELATVNGFGDKLKVDFSVIDDANYYNGFVFKGFINGVSSWVLSGGQYDNLMKKMRSDYGAIGFAVYLDMLDGYCADINKYDVDNIVLYDNDTDILKLNNTVSQMAANSSVMALRYIPDNIKYKTLYKITESGVEVIGNNA